MEYDAQRNPIESWSRRKGRKSWILEERKWHSKPRGGDTIILIVPRHHLEREIQRLQGKQGPIALEEVDWQTRMHAAASGKHDGQAPSRCKDQIQVTGPSMPILDVWH